MWGRCSVKPRMRAKEVATCFCALVMMCTYILLYTGNESLAKAGKRLGLWKHQALAKPPRRSEQHGSTGEIGMSLPSSTPVPPTILGGERAEISLQVAEDKLKQQAEGQERGQSSHYSFTKPPPQQEDVTRNQSTSIHHAASNSDGAFLTEEQKHVREPQGQKEKVIMRQEESGEGDPHQQEEQLPWARAWSRDAAHVLRLGVHKHDAQQHAQVCAASMPHIVMHKINGSALTTTMRAYTKVITASTPTLLRSWNQTTLADEFNECEVRWVRDAVDSLLHLPADVVNSTRMSGAHREFGEHMHAGEGLRAALQISPYHNGSSPAGREPWPGLMVMYNARFWTMSVFVNDCRVVYASCCW
jgi:hypothetical protein